MPRGTLFRAGELAGRLEALDIDEGIRIENAGDKMFINRNASGVFVVQHGNDFQYLNSAKHVVKTTKSRFGSNYTVWVY
jgi:hypothetical protein